jgi:hypothetical protein
VGLNARLLVVLLQVCHDLLGVPAGRLQPGQLLWLRSRSDTLDKEEYLYKIGIHIKKDNVDILYFVRFSHAYPSTAREWQKI